MVLINRNVEDIVSTLVDKNVRTGDMILFGNTMCLSKIIELFGDSEFSHVGLIINSYDLTMEQKSELGLPYDDLYIMHSTIFNNIIDVFTKKINKKGCQINNMASFLAIEKGLDNIYIRHLYFPSETEYKIFITKMIELYKSINTSLFDIDFTNILRAKIILSFGKTKSKYEKILSLLSFGNLIDIEHTDKFLCSSFVTFIYVKTNIIEEKNWSIALPKYLSSNDSNNDENENKDNKDKDNVKVKFITMKNNIKMSDNILIYIT